jgi:RimJ/RimL family protein N-acetyltransferase
LVCLPWKTKIEVKFGTKLHFDHWGKGHGTEAVNRVLDFGFNDLNLHRIKAGCAVENIASIKVLEKVGMIREGEEDSCYR